MPRIFISNPSDNGRPSGLPQTIVVDGDKSSKDTMTKKATLTKEEELKREALLEKAFSSQYGLQKLAQALQEPVRRYLDIYPIGRQLLFVEQKNEGEIAYYDLDLEMFPAISIARDGATRILYLKAERIFVDSFEIGVVAKVPLREMRWRKYNVLERAKERLRTSFGIKEDLIVFNALEGTANVVNPEIDATAGFTLPAVAKAFEQIEKHNLVGYSIVVNPHAIADLRSWTNANVDEVARIEIRQTGYLGQIFGANMFISRLVPVVKSGTNPTIYVSSAYATAHPQFIGVMPFWADSEIYASNNLDDFQVGFVGWEMLGVSLWNPRSVVKMKFNIAA